MKSAASSQPCWRVTRQSLNGYWVVLWRTMFCSKISLLFFYFCLTNERVTVKMHIVLVIISDIEAFFFLVRLGFERRALYLQSRHFMAWATTPVHFALVILHMGISWTICLGYPGSTVFWTSASQVARITDMSHWHLVW
jgi:hypothetical protein